MFAKRNIQKLVPLLLVSITLLVIVCSPAGVLAQTANGGGDQVAECTGLSSWISLNCWYADGAVLLHDMIVGLPTLFIWITGGLFDYLIEYTVVGFGEFYNLIEVGVNSAWSVFRDVANIFIIGAFVFVAISTILNIEEYGIRRFVAKILIVAVLINFSLFFTKLIVDASNITAAQFATLVDPNMLRATPVTEGGITAAGQGNADDSVSSKLIEYMKLPTFGDNDGIVRNIANDADGGLLAVVSSAFITGILFIFVAIIFAFASFLLLSRFVVIIMALMLSPLAFAAFAIPRLDRWWTMWWNHLLKSAFFAPLFMMFLWAIAEIARSVSIQVQGSLGDLAAGPSTGFNMLVLLNYLLIAGLLIAAIHISRSLSILGARQLPTFKTMGKYGLSGGKFAFQNFRKAATVAGGNRQKMWEGAKANLADAQPSKGVMAHMRRNTAISDSNALQVAQQLRTKQEGAAQRGSGPLQNIPASARLGGFQGPVQGITQDSVEKKSGETRKQTIETEPPQPQPQQEKQESSGTKTNTTPRKNTYYEERLEALEETAAEQADRQGKHERQSQKTQIQVSEQGEHIRQAQRNVNSLRPNFSPEETDDIRKNANDAEEVRGVWEEQQPKQRTAAQETDTRAAAQPYSGSLRKLFTQEQAETRPTNEAVNMNVQKDLDTEAA